MFAQVTDIILLYRLLFRGDYMSELDNIKYYAYKLRLNALNMAYTAKSHASHFGAGMSIIEILAVLYGKILNLNKDNSCFDNRDRFILSKGHGVIGYYAALTEFGFIPKDDLKDFEQNNSYLMGHPVRDIEHGIEFTNGSLGMGLSLAIGTAISAKKKKQSYKTYVLLGDGELDEGSVWEGFMAAKQFKLDNLVAIIDKNNLQLGGLTESIINHEDLVKKLTDFGWNAKEIDGHDIEQLINAFSTIEENEKPTAIIANTIKGKGFSFSENNNSWHHAILSKQNYENALKELESNYNGIK